MIKDIKIDPYGFREYDARWLYEKDINQIRNRESWQRFRKSNYKAYHKKRIQE